MNSAPRKCSYRAPIVGTLLTIWLWETVYVGLGTKTGTAEMAADIMTFPVFGAINTNTTAPTRNRTTTFDPNRNASLPGMRKQKQLNTSFPTARTSSATAISTVTALQKLEISKTALLTNDNKPVPISYPNVGKATLPSALLGVPLTEYQQKSSPVQDLLKVYVYDNLPAKFSTDIHACIQEESFQHERAETMHTEMALIRLFQTFPGRTYDPNEADIFVVPYMHNAHYMFCSKDQYMNKYMINHPNMEDPALEELFHSLTYYNATSSSSSRHLFFAMAGPYLTNRRIDALPFVITPGPRRTAGQFKKTRRKQPPPNQGHIVVPLFNHHPSYQPSVLLRRNLAREGIADNWWTDIGRRRQYAFAFATSLFNPRMQTNHRRFRQYFYNYTQHQGELVVSKMLGGRQIIVRDSAMTTVTTTTVTSMTFITNDTTQTRLTTSPPRALDGNNTVTMSSTAGMGQYHQDLYQASVFCPILPGDTTWQKRFFDVILNGCLPVVWAWKRKYCKRCKDYISWSAGIQYPPPVLESYPFVSHQFGYSRDIGTRGKAEVAVDELIDIDYESFVVECIPNATMESDVFPMMQAMQKLLSSPNELARRQLAMQQAALSFTYGVGPDAHRYNDAFAHLIRTIQRDIILTTNTTTATLN